MNTEKPRKSLIQLTSETKVRDPAAHARHQVVELDKTAKRSQARRKACHDSIEADKKEISHIDEQIRRYTKQSSGYIIRIVSSSVMTSDCFQAEGKV